VKQLGRWESSWASYGGRVVAGGCQKMGHSRLEQWLALAGSTEQNMVYVCLQEEMRVFWS